MPVPQVRLGVIGYGTVGRQFVEAVRARRARLEDAAGVRLTISEIAARTPRPQPVTADGARIHTDAAALAHNPAIDVLVEVTGAAAAAEWMAAALQRGAAVVTANKRALAGSPALLAALAARRPGLYCEGSVAAAVPIVRALRDSLQGEEIRSIRGVLNGTTTHVLSAIEAGHSFLGALADARRQGICELDAQLDLSGEDAACKLAILCTLAWGRPVAREQIAVSGIALGIEERVRAALQRTRRVRLVASATAAEADIVAAVSPTTLRGDDPLAQASGVNNVVELECALAGTLRWTGPGAGARATASALLGDVVSAARWVAQLQERRVAA